MKMISTLLVVLSLFSSSLAQLDGSQTRVVESATAGPRATVTGAPTKNWLAGPFTEADLFYSTSPIGSTVWVAGTKATLIWQIPTPMNKDVKNIHIELGVGEGTVVNPAGVVVAESIPYPGTTTLTFDVPADLPARNYCLIIVGTDGSKSYGPNWSTWFKISAAGTGGAVTTPTAPAAPTTTSSTSKSPDTTNPAPKLTEDLSTSSASKELSWLGTLFFAAAAGAVGLV